MNEAALSGSETVMTIYTFTFDFEVGTLVKSPCRNCEHREKFPKCISGCERLDRIQSILAGTRSSARRS